MNTTTLTEIALLTHALAIGDDLAAVEPALGYDLRWTPGGHPAAPTYEARTPAAGGWLELRVSAAAGWEAGVPRGTPLCAVVWTGPGGAVWTAPPAAGAGPALYRVAQALAFAAGAHYVAVPAHPAAPPGVRAAPPAAAPGFGS